MLRIMQVFFIIFVAVGISRAQEPTFTKRTITDTWVLAKKMHLIDFDSDGDMDIVASANDTTATPVNIAWFENDGTEVFTQRDVEGDLSGARAARAADLNGDTYLDILGGGDGSNPLTWWANDGTPSDGGWTKATIGPTDSSIYSIRTIDFDGDGRNDITATYANFNNDTDGDKIRIFKNNGSGSFEADTLVENYEAASSVYIDDINNDGEWDIVSTAGGNLLQLDADNTGRDISWWENDGDENFTKNTISTDFAGSWFCSTEDMDRDGDRDILVAGYYENELAWWSNDGNGNFGTKQVVATGFTNARSMYGSDVDGDGDIDIVGAADEDHTVAWYENDGNQNFTTHNLSTSFTYAYYAFPVDMDGDGDVDVAASSQDDNEIAWWENDQAEEKYIASDGDPASEPFNDGKVIIDYGSLYDGDTTSVFFNQGENDNRNQVAGGLDHVALSGYYTIVTDAGSYSADIEFYYGDIQEWSAIDNDGDLRICYWDVDSGTDGAWVVLDSDDPQSVDPTNEKITVTGVDIELHKYSLFTLGSVSSDNPLPVALVSFNAKAEPHGIQLQWQTASELENLGFELWRKTDRDTVFQKIASYQTHDALSGQGNTGSGRKYQYVDVNVQRGDVYYYRLVDVSFDGRRFEHPAIDIPYLPENVAKIIENGLPTRPELAQNYPNPFNNNTSFEIAVPDPKKGASDVVVEIYDMLGRRIKSIYNGNLNAGRYIMRWNGRDDNGRQVASGMYIYRLQVGEVSQTRKLQLIK